MFHVKHSFRGKNVSRETLELHTTMFHVKPKKDKQQMFHVKHSVLLMITFHVKHSDLLMIMFHVKHKKERRTGRSFFMRL